MRIPRLMIAATRSGDGKTTVTTGLLACLARRLKVQPYKVGPDYIDPGFHRAVTGRESRNLDLWMCGQEGVREIFCRAAVDADLCLVEGVMGLFDGHGVAGSASSAEVAVLLDLPVILVIDVHSMARSAAAVVLGFREMEPRVNLAGVILNRVGSDRHLKLVKGAVEEVTGVPVVGWLPADANLTLPERHLGLVPVGEGDHLERRINLLVEKVAKHIDLDLLLELAKKAGELPEPAPSLFRRRKKVRARVGLALDKAFSFYYADNLDLFRQMGVEFVPFSPLSDRELPPGITGLYIGGGFPEVYMRELAANREMLTAVRRAVEEGMPVYAECGGYMFLMEAVSDLEGNLFPAAGVVPGTCRMEKRLVGMGYAEGELVRDSLLGPAGTRVRGHEFHYSRYLPVAGKESWALRLLSGRREGQLEGYARDNVFASYLHIHFASNPQAAEHLAERWAKGGK